MKAITTTAMILSAFLAGCGYSLRPTSEPPPAAVAAPAGADYMARPAAAEREDDKTSAVDSALELSHKYAKTLEELSQARDQANALADKNVQLQAQAVKLTSDLDQARKELADANAMLMEFRQELERWKANVLGFREEIRDSQVAQLEAMRRILKLLGGQEPPSMKLVDDKLRGSAQPTTAPASQPVSASAGGGNAIK